MKKFIFYTITLLTFFIISNSALAAKIKNNLNKEITAQPAVGEPITVEANKTWNQKTTLTIVLIYSNGTPVCNKQTWQLGKDDTLTVNPSKHCTGPNTTHKERRCQGRP